MRLTELHVRFYKAFNFDYLRKYDRRTVHLPWEEMEDGSWYPFVTVPLESDITTVVGANESGKTQVLDAIEVALTGHGLLRTDFCRYSKFFLVDQVVRLPDIGLTLVDLSPEEANEIGQACGREEAAQLEEFKLMRVGNGKATVYEIGRAHV